MLTAFELHLDLVAGYRDILKNYNPNKNKIEASVISTMGWKAAKSLGKFYHPSLLGSLWFQRPHCAGVIQTLENSQGEKLLVN